MSQEATPQNILILPSNAGRAIVKEGALIARPLLRTDEFIKFCKARGLSLDRERLIRLERLGLFAPIFRVRTPPGARRHFVIPPTADNDWFKQGWAWDTTSVRDTYAVPDSKDRNHEGYYSIFQIGHLDFILSYMTLSMHMDSFLEVAETSEVAWNQKGKQWLKLFKNHASVLRDNDYRRSQALLCQFISNRYYPHTQGDQRTIQVSDGFFVDPWISVNNTMNWDWHEYVRHWKPSRTIQLFHLTREKLRHAYEGLAIAQESCDPMARWYQLIQFVSVSERRKLKGDALRAETLRAGAHMLRLLYKDLYGEGLPHPNEVTGTVITHMPELEVRRDTRRYLEFVANRYGLNPQPKLCLMVEGPSEELAVLKIFESWFGAHPGKRGIEIISLGGVDTATGGKEDRFRAILRLVDYLHHHQTFTFLMLDNENYAKRLKVEARKKKSRHQQRRYVTRPEYIKIWRRSFEMDNFSATEIAAALSALAPGKVRFTRSAVTTCMKGKNPMASLNDFYKRKTGGDIPKLQLAERLVDGMLAKGVRRTIESRPIVKTLERVATLAARNHPPTMLNVWEHNQASKYFGKKGR